MRPVPMRSWPSRYLATVQPLPSSCTRFSTGTFTSSKKTSLTSWPPSIRMIGRTVMPGVFMSISRKEMPSWRLSRLGVGAHQAEDPVGVVGERGPDLLAGDHVVVALAAPRASSARPGPSPSPAPSSPGTRSPRRRRSAAGSAASARRCRSARARARTCAGRTAIERRRAGVAALLLEDVALRRRSSPVPPHSFGQSGATQPFFGEDLVPAQRGRPWSAPGSSRPCRADRRAGSGRASRAPRRGRPFPRASSSGPSGALLRAAGRVTAGRAQGMVSPASAFGDRWSHSAAGVVDIEPKPYRLNVARAQR